MEKKGNPGGEHSLPIKKTQSAGFQGVRELHHRKAWWLGSAELNLPVVSAQCWALKEKNSNSVYPCNVGNATSWYLSGKINSSSYVVLGWVTVLQFLSLCISWIYLCSFSRMWYVMLTPWNNSIVNPSPPLPVHHIYRRKELVEVHTDNTTGLSEHINILYAANHMHQSVQNRVVCDGVLRRKNQSGESRQDKTVKGYWRLNWMNLWITFSLPPPLKARVGSVF